LHNLSNPRRKYRLHQRNSYILRILRSSCPRLLRTRSRVRIRCIAYRQHSFRIFLRIRHKLSHTRCNRCRKYILDPRSFCTVRIRHSSCPHRLHSRSRSRSHRTAYRQRSFRISHRTRHKLSHNLSSPHRRHTRIQSRTCTSRSCRRSCRRLQHIPYRCCIRRRSLSPHNWYIFHCIRGISLCRMSTHRSLHRGFQRSFYTDRSPRRSCLLRLHSQSRSRSHRTAYHPRSFRTSLRNLYR